MASQEGGITEQIRLFFTQSSIYGFGLAFNRFIIFLTLPVLTARLTPADLGVLTLLQVFSSILMIFLNAGVQQAINRNYYDENTDEHRAAVVGTGLLWRLITTGAIVGGLAVAALPVTRLLLGESSRLFVIYYLFTLANIAVMSPQGIAYTLYRVRMQATRNTFFSVTGSLLSLAMLVWLVLWRSRGVRGSLEAAVIANALVTFAMAPDLLRSARLRLRRDVLRGILSYGLPFLPHHLAIYLLFGADRYFLQYYRTMTEVGLYSYAYRIGTIMSLVLEGCSLAWTPFIFSIHKRPDARRIHALTARYMLALIVWTAVGVITFGPELIRLLALRSPEYWEAAGLVGWIVGGYVFLGVYQVFGAAVGIPKRTTLLPLYSFGGLAVNLGLNWALVPRYGMLGAAVATLIAYMCMGGIALVVTQKVYPIPYEWRRLLILAMAGMLAIFAGWVLPEWPFWSRMVAKAGCVFLFPALLFLMGFFNEEERQRIAWTIRRLIARIT